MRRSAEDERSSAKANGALGHLIRWQYFHHRPPHRPGFYIVCTPSTYYLCAVVVSLDAGPSLDEQLSIRFKAELLTEPRDLLRFMVYCCTQSVNRFQMKAAAEPVPPPAFPPPPASLCARSPGLFVEEAGNLTAPVFRLIWIFFLLLLSFFLFSVGSSLTVCRLNGHSLEVTRALSDHVWEVASGDDSVINGSAALKLAREEYVTREATVLRVAQVLPRTPRLLWFGPTNVRQWAILTGPVGERLRVQGPASESTVLAVARDILHDLADLAQLGMAFVRSVSAHHSADIRHHDVSVANIVRFGTRYGLVDYGLASVGRCHGLEMCGTKRFMSVRCVPPYYCASRSLMQDTCSSTGRARHGRRWLRVGRPGISSVRAAIPSPRGQSLASDEGFPGRLSGVRERGGGGGVCDNDVEGGMAVPARQQHAWPDRVASQGHGTAAATDSPRANAVRRAGHPRGAAPVRGYAGSLPAFFSMSV